jgi:hypothetical protein
MENFKQKKTTFALTCMSQRYVVEYCANNTNCYANTVPIFSHIFYLYYYAHKRFYYCGLINFYYLIYRKKPIINHKY